LTASRKNSPSIFRRTPAVVTDRSRLRQEVRPYNCPQDGDIAGCGTTELPDSIEAGHRRAVNRHAKLTP
jgi:hypothetical protein